MRLDPDHLHPSLSANVVSFARLLRARGMGVGPQEEHDALQALACLDLTDRAAFRMALRTTLAKDPREHEVFDALFGPFWDDLPVQPRKPPTETTVRERPAGRPGGPLAIREWLAGPRRARGEAVLAYSPDAVRTQVDFRHLTPDDLAEMTPLIRQLARPLAVRHSRRHRPAGPAGRLDVRRTLRRNLRRGGELLELAYRRPRPERLDLVLLCDVSRSMDAYSRFFIPFVYAFQHVYRHIETFVFSTELHRVTDLLRGGTLPEVLAALPDHVPDWGGGTRIGEALTAFLARHGARVRRRTVLVILSDGWDTGAPDRVAGALRTLHRRAHRILWLNPLMGHPGFRPDTGALRAALPYLDLLAPAHNVDSLRRTVRHLVRL